jgi:hypothetical protein
MNDPEPPHQSSLVLYQTKDGQTRLECRFEEGTIWLTQAQMADLFQTTTQKVTLHLKAIFADGELPEEATCKDYLHVRQEGQRVASQQAPSLRVGYYSGLRLPRPLSARHPFPPLASTHFPRTAIPDRMIMEPAPELLPSWKTSSSASRFPCIPSPKSDGTKKTWKQF